MIIEIELAALVALTAVGVFRRRSSPAPASSSPQILRHAEIAPVAPAPVAPAASVEIIKQSGDQWLHVGFRHAEHPDIHVALETPGLAVRHGSGRIEAGRQ